MHQALYRKWRPATFDQVVGQEHITSVLQYEIEHGTFSHAYLFCGSRGTGKTTCAKILAKAVNCEAPVNGSPCGKCPSCKSIEAGAATDVLEMDAASNNGVDNIRDIRDEVVYTPSQLKYRVYIVDEVHMLSGSAFNALLKTLEEPPEHVIFILATTELQKLPATIISRCQRFDFRRISLTNLTDRLMEISRAEGIDTDENAARLIAKLAQGGMRDAISLLDLCSGSNRRITVSDVEENAGITGRGIMIDTVKAIAKKDYSVIFDTIAQVLSSSKDLSVFWQDLISVYRDILVIKTTQNSKKYLDLTDAEVDELSSLSALFTKETLLSHCKILDNSFYNMQRGGASKRMIAEMTLIRMCDETLDSSSEALLSRISKLEYAVSVASISSQGGATPSCNAPAQPSDVKEASDDSPIEAAPRPTVTAPKSNDTPKDVSKATKSSSGKTALKTVRCKMEIAEKLALTDIPSSSFLKSAAIYEAANGIIIIRSSNDFAVSMLSRAQTKRSLANAVSACLMREVGENSIIIEVGTETDADKYDILDELMDN